MLFALLLIALVSTAVAQSSPQCSFYDPNGYSLTWRTENGKIIFNLTYTNFPTNAYTGIAFGEDVHSGLDAILVEVNGYQPQVLDATIQGYNPPQPLNDGAVSVISTRYINQVLNAQFSRSLSMTNTNHKSLMGCVTFNFFNSPGNFTNGQYSIIQNNMAQMQVCNVDSMCGQGAGNGAQYIPQMNQPYGQNQQNGPQQYQPYNQQQPPYSQQYNPTMNQPYSNQNSQYNQQMNQQPYQQQAYLQQQQGMQTTRGYGYSPNTGTTPAPQAYTGTPFNYQTSSVIPPQDRMNSTSNQRMYDSNYNQYSSNNFNQQPQSGYTSQYQPWPSQQYSGYSPSSNQMQFQASSAPYQPNQPMYQPMGNQQQPQNSYYRPTQQYNGRVRFFLRKKRSVRSKRQSTYQPTNNIYGYDYNSNSQPISGGTLVMNPNYKYLNGPLADEYSKSYAIAEQDYDSTDGTSMNLNGNAPVLSNQQQNTANYQQIQRDYAANPNPTAGQQYTNNIYGYNYQSSASSSPQYSPQYSQSYSTSSSSSYSQPTYNPNTMLFYPQNPASTPSPAVYTVQRDPSLATATPTYESASNLKETALRYPPEYPATSGTSSVTGVQRDQPSTTNSQYSNSPPYYSYYDVGTHMYYPYRTTIDDQTSNGQVQYSNQAGSQQYQSSSGIYYDSTTGRMRDRSDPCALQDPYWCDEYVQIYMNSKQLYDKDSQQNACQSLISSLQESYNGCCHAARAAGCSA